MRLNWACGCWGESRMTDWKYKLKQSLFSFRDPLIAVLISLLIGGIAIAAKGEPIGATYALMFKGAFGHMHYLASTLVGVSSVVICGMAVAVAWRCGYVNLGVEGQMMWGGLTAALVAVRLPGPPVVVILIAIFSGMVTAAFYATIVAWLYDKFRASMVITTIMMNYIAKALSFYLVQYHFLDPNLSDTAAVKTQAIDRSIRLPRIFPQFNLHIGFIVALASVAFFWWLFKYTRFGYRSKICGLNPNFAEYGGIDKRKLLYTTMALSGAVAGLAAGLEVLGTRYCYLDNMFGTSGYAWTGITAALMSRHNPIVILLSSIFLYGLNTGCAAVQRSTTIPVEVSNIIQGVITLLVSVQFTVEWNRHATKAGDSRKEAGSNES